jgi:hypothetical protein
MSNRVNIEQYSKKMKTSGEVSNFVEIFDNYEIETICLDNYNVGFFDDNLELLKFLIDLVIEDESYSRLESIFDYVVEDEKGIMIENTFYDWDDIKTLFKKYVDTE